MSLTTQPGGTGAAGSQAPSPRPVAEHPHARLSLICDRARPGPGEVVRLGVRLQMDKGWHVYWNGFNDAGMAPRFTLTLPPGYTAGQALWPAPERHVSPGGILDHIYEGELTVLVPVRVPRDAEPTGTAHFGVKCEWMVCSTICKLEESAAELSVPLKDAQGSGVFPGQSEADKRSVAETVKRLPRPMAEAKGKVRALMREGRVEFAVDGATGLAFYPSEECVWFADLLHEGEAEGGGLTLRFEEGKAGPVSGILGVVGADGKSKSWYRVDLPGEDEK